MKFYLDTSIWLDLTEKRGCHGEIAKQLIGKIILENHTIICSDYVIIELSRLGYSQNDIYAAFSIVRNNTKRVHMNNNQVTEAKKIAKNRNVPYGDALHAVISRDNEAQFITRDEDFLKLKDITKAQRPEDLL